MDEQEAVIPKEIGDVLDKEAPVANPATDKSWKLMSDAKIPVSKHLGGIWKTNRDSGKKVKQPFQDAWDQAHKYYNNDQLNHRTSQDGDVSGNRNANLNENPNWASTENIVYANTQAIVSSTYAKNPTVEITAGSAANKDFATFYESVMNALLGRKYAPGVNFKPVAKRAVARAHLSNNGIVRIGYRSKQDPDYETMRQIAELEEKFKSAKDGTELEQLLGDYDALQEHMAVLDPPGLFVKNVDECNLIVDPDSVDPDFNDARWLMERDRVPTSYLNARYGKKDPESNEVKSVYNPTHVLSPVVDEQNDELNSFTLFKDEEPTRYGYNSKDLLDKAKFTEVWWCWDKLTRRLYLFADNNWKWPVWVWDDPLQLIEFFPYYRLQFTINLYGPWSKGETTYYLDQQDMINEISTIHSRALHMVKNKWFFNKRIDDARDIENFLRADDRMVYGLDIPEGFRKEDLLFSLAHPALEHPEILNKDTLLQAIDRISSVNSVMRGSEFKTNTTNMAIQEYNSTQQTTLDEKIDAIEDWVGRVAYGLLQLVVQFYTEEEFVTLVGQDRVAAAQPTTMTPQELAQRYTLSLKGGSSLKPTSAQKKKQFIELAQVFGQFEVPGILELVLRMAEQAFDELLVTDEDWKMLREQAQQSLQTAGGGPGAQPQQGPPQPGQPPQSAAPDPQQIVQQLVQRGLPPEEAEAAVQRVLTQGEPQ